jgi:hypothetical protein
MATADPRQKIIAAFPRLRHSQFKISSPPDHHYNCIGWAAGSNRQLWWPGTIFWPRGCPTEETVDAFIRAFQTVRYEVCENVDLQGGYEKIALYAINGKPTHAARQLRTGKWTSKLGLSYDIEHESPDSLADGEYGQVVLILKRLRRDE